MTSNRGGDCTFSHLLFTPVSAYPLLNIFMKEGIPMAQSSHVLSRNPSVFNTDSRILILGSFPSCKITGKSFFYGHPRNRFWDLLATLTGEPLPAGIEEKKITALHYRIAVVGCDRLVISKAPVTAVSTMSFPMTFQRFFRRHPSGRDFHQRWHCRPLI